MTNIHVEIPEIPVRKFIPQDFKLDSWSQLEPYYKELTEREVNSLSELKQWMLDRSELDAFVSEDFRWRYVKVSCDTTNITAEEALKGFYENIDPKLKAVAQDLNQKLVESKYLNELDPTKYAIYLRSVNNYINLYREENLPIFKKLNIEQKRYQTLIGAMTVEYNGEEFTFQQAGKFLNENNRAKRETIYRLIAERRLKERVELDSLFDDLLKLRQEIAVNAGFDNYRDYKFSAMGRFDYTSEDCFQFHDAIAKEVTPLATMMLEERKEQMGLETIRPWDLSVDPQGAAPLTPFTDTKELVDKSVECLGKVDPFFGHCLDTMNRMSRLDLGSRPGKAPGGYNMGMPETGVPFVFMNAAGTDNDIRVMLHEAGHSVHSFLSFPLELMNFRTFPSEIAELASMSMELFTMDHWDVYYGNEADFTRAKRNQLRSIIKLLPWIATIDKFQHWIYTNPGHTVEERTEAWLDVYDSLNPNVVDWTEIEDMKASLWQRQGHLFDVPFYYIEYAIAQLGAVAMWKQYKENPSAAIENYIAALKLGYTQSLPNLYETAGIQFRFDREYLAEIVAFLKKEYEAL